jgi:hypothetical protein
MEFFAGLVGPRNAKKSMVSSVAWRSSPPRTMTHVTIPSTRARVRGLSGKDASCVTCLRWAAIFRRVFFCHHIFVSAIFQRPHKSRIKNSTFACRRYAIALLLTSDMTRNVSVHFAVICQFSKNRGSGLRRFLGQLYDTIIEKSEADQGKTNDERSAGSRAPRSRTALHSRRRRANFIEARPPNH